MITRESLRLRRRAQQAPAPEVVTPQDAAPHAETVPFGDGGLAVAVRKLSAEDGGQRQPSFTPARDPLRPTGQQEALAAPRHERFTDARQDTDLLRRVRDGLLGLGSGRTAEFRADRRDLPLFRGTARQVGWCGLHADREWGKTRYTFATWEKRTRDAIGNQVMQFRSDADEQLGRAMAEIDMRLDAYLKQQPHGRAA